MKGKKILLINPGSNPFTDPEILIEPIDLLTVGSFMKTLGFEVVLYDFDREQQGPEYLTILLEDINPDLLVIPFDYHIPLFTSAAVSGVQKILSIAKDHGVRTVLGGKPATYYPHFFLDSQNVVIAAGDLEPALEQLCRLEDWSPVSLSAVSGIIYRNADKLVRTAPRSIPFSLNALPIADRSLLDTKRYIDVRSLLSSRGCIERCKFCPVHQFWGNWRPREASLVVDEIEYLVSKYSARKILFLDDNALVDKARMQKIAAGIIERGIKITLGCLATPGSVDDFTLELMAEAGFRWIHFGAESGSQRVLEFLGKRTSPKTIKESCLKTKKHGLRVRTSWIIDAPGSTEEDLDKTCELILETRPDEIRAHYLTYRAGAPLTPASDELPEQYIHTADRKLSPSSVSDGVMNQRIKQLTRELVELGYLAIRDSVNWGKISQTAKSDTRFISFCPSRYGIGWRI